MNTTSATTPTYLETKVTTYPPPSTRHMSDEELMAPETWDWDSVVKVEPLQKRARSVVSVAFSAEQFDIVDAKAERLSKKLSTWLREVALRAAKR